MRSMMTAIGLMSGTSLDGIDVAMLATDGERLMGRGQSLSFPYTPEQRQRLDAAVEAAWRIWGPDAGHDRAAGGQSADDMALLEEVERELTQAHADAVQEFMQTFGISRQEAGLIGFHGQTVYHDASRRITRQLGSGSLLARLTGIDVVHDFRSADVAAGGQGAPLVPVYHKAMSEEAGLERPLAIVNIGGVANLTWIGANGAVLAFDVGPGNGLIDDWVQSRTGLAFDKNGALAQRGEVRREVLASLASHPFFARKPPKSLDRHDFPPLVDPDLSTEDGAATLTAFTALGIAKAVPFLPEAPRLWMIAGGGAKNPAMLSAIADAVEGQVVSADEMGWSADHVEAEAFAFLAVRSVRRLPLTFPGTTGVAQPMSGGRYAAAPKR
jgi:anhydro-N-acetylmuramic acid kinase